MKITKTKRLEFEHKQFRGGTVSPKTSFVNDLPVYKNGVASGLVIKNIWYELPDNINGDYVLIEILNTNNYGYVEVGESERKLISKIEADNLEAKTIRGVINQIAEITVNGDNAHCEYNEINLVRSQRA